MGIVGREPELAAITRLLDRGRIGPAGLAIDGEAGIGKSTLVAEAAHLARDRGYAVVECRGVEAEGGWSLVPIADVLEQLPEHVLEGLPSPQQHALDVVRRHTDPGDRPVEQGTIAAGLRAALTRLAAEQATLLVLDDVQWLDAASAAVIDHTVRRLRTDHVAVLTARRLPEATTLDIARSLPQGSVEEHVVSSMTVGAVRRLLEDRLGRRVTRSTLTRIHEGSRGNPLFAIEIGQVLVEHGVPPIGQPLPVPDDVQALIRRRVDQLSVEARGTLLGVALTRPTGVDIGELTTEQAAHIEAAARAGIVVVDGRVARFAHPFHASAVVAGASDQQRRQIHADRAREATAPDDRARHLACSVVGADSEVAAAIEAGAELALRSGAAVDGAQLLVRAWELTPKENADEAARRGTRAAEYYVAVGEADRAGEILTKLGTADLTATWAAEVVRLRAELAFVDDDNDAGERLLEESLALDAGNHLSTLALVTVLSEREAFDAATELAKALLGRLDEARDAPLVAQALAHLAMVRQRAGAGVDWAMIERAAELEIPDRVPPNFDRPSLLAAYLTIHTARFDESRRLLLGIRDDQIVRGVADGQVQAVLSTLEILEGDFTAAAACLEEGQDLANLAGDAAIGSLCTASLAVVEAFRGRLDRVEAIASSLGERVDRLKGPVPKHITCARLVAAVSEGRYQSAWEVARPRVHHVEDNGLNAPAHEYWLLEAIEALAGIDEFDRAQRLTQSWEELGQQLDYPWVRATGARCRAVIAAARGDHEGAITTAAEAVTIHDTVGMPFQRARALFVKGGSERRLRRRRAARASLTEAVAEFERMDCAIWAERARSELDRVGGRPSSDGSLTRSERQVVELAARGLTNKEIAAALTISVHTVESHLSHSFTKLGVSRRSQLAGKLTEKLTDGEAAGTTRP